MSDAIRITTMDELLAEANRVQADVTRSTLRSPQPSEGNITGQAPAAAKTVDLSVGREGLFRPA